MRAARAESTGSRGANERIWLILAHEMIVLESPEIICKNRERGNEGARGQEINELGAGRAHRGMAPGLTALL